MRCPECNTLKSTVIDSRPTDLSVTRRRKCTNCGHRYTTYERLAVGKTHVVAAADGEVLAVISAKEIIEKNGISVTQTDD